VPGGRWLSARGLSRTWRRARAAAGSRAGRSCAPRRSRSWLCGRARTGPAPPGPGRAVPHRRCSGTSRAAPDRSATRGGLCGQFLHQVAEEQVLIGPAAVDGAARDVGVPDDVLKADVVQADRQAGLAHTIRPRGRPGRPWPASTGTGLRCRSRGRSRSRSPAGISGQLMAPRRPGPSSPGRRRRALAARLRPWTGSW